MLRIAVISLFPEMLAAVSEHGVTGRALKQGLLEVLSLNPRDYAADRHRTVDDRPYGGGPGMVMKVAPLGAAVRAARKLIPAARVIYLSPQGCRLDQQGVQHLAAHKNLILVAGRYEGVDERFIELFVDEEWSIGDYVLSGGELPVMVLIDAMARTVPGVLGHADSAGEDSFCHGLGGLLDYPHYTRPENFAGRRVPEVLLSGDHAAVRRWRRQQTEQRTRQRRPDLFEGVSD